MASQVHGLHYVSDNSHKFGALSGSVRLVLDLLVAASVPQILVFLAIPCHARSQWKCPRVGGSWQSVGSSQTLPAVVTALRCSVASPSNVVLDCCPGSHFHPCCCSTLALPPSCFLE
jgi:hypothetical protein